MQSIRDIISIALDECIVDIKQRHVAAGQRASGRGMASLESRMEEGDGFFRGDILGFAYIGAWEAGRGPAKRSGTPAEQIEFLASLAEWCKIRGFPSSSLTDEQYIRIAKWLKWYINKFGTKLYRNGGRKDIITPAIEALGEKLQKALEVYYTQEITNNFFNSKR